VLDVLQPGIVALREPAKAPVDGCQAGLDGTLATPQPVTFVDDVPITVVLLNGGPKVGRTLADARAEDDQSKRTLTQMMPRVPSPAAREGLSINRRKRPG